MQNPQYAAYKPADPYFSLVRRALGDLVDGQHFFDIVAEGIAYEVLYEIAGWPRVIRGRADLMAQFAGYCGNVALNLPTSCLPTRQTMVVPSSSNMRSTGPYWRRA